MTDFSKILDKAKELENKMKESQEKIKNIEVVGISGADSISRTTESLAASEDKYAKLNEVSMKMTATVTVIL